MGIWDINPKTGYRGIGYNSWPPGNDGNGAVVSFPCQVWE